MKKIYRRELDEIKPYEPGKSIEEVQRELKLDGVVKLASNETSLPPFPEAVKAMESVLCGVNRYPDDNCLTLKDKLSIFLRVPVENMMIGHGSNELIKLIAQALLYPEDEAIMSTPSFAFYEMAVKIMGGVCQAVPLKNFRHDLESILERINSKTKLIMLDIPNNPVGTIVYQDELDKFLAKVPEEVVIILDQAYFEYVEDKRCPDGLNYFRNEDESLATAKQKIIIVLRTFSKVYSLAGCRIGYGVAPKFLVEVVNKIREPFDVNSIAQAGALASLDCPDEVEKRRLLNLKQKRYLYDGLRWLGVEFIPTEGNFIFINLRQDSRKVFDKLLFEGVIVRTGDIFGLGYENYIRVSIGTPEENKKFVEALRKVL
ncbi:MAG: histidinol-phosphate transaminase [Candidatus Subteraquimicrobiales bacterium]|nr:histidinol-phosphate transaminase [Candidatus Subteraquimicrobiales bacterium]